MSLPAPAGRDYKPHNARRRPLAMTSFSVAPTNPSRSRGVAAASSSRLLLVVRPPPPASAGPLLLSRDFPLLRRSLYRRPSRGPGPSLFPPPRPTRSPAPQPRLAAAMADPKYADLPGIVSTGPGPAPQTAPPTSRGPPHPQQKPARDPSRWPPLLRPEGYRRSSIHGCSACWTADRAGPGLLWTRRLGPPFPGSSRFLRPEIAPGRLPLAPECVCRPCQHCPCRPPMPRLPVPPLPPRAHPSSSPS